MIRGKERDVSWASGNESAWTATHSHLPMGRREGVEQKKWAGARGSLVKDRQSRSQLEQESSNSVSARQRTILKNPKMKTNAEGGQPFDKTMHTRLVHNDFTSTKYIEYKILSDTIQGLCFLLHPTLSSDFNSSIRRNAQRAKLRHHHPCNNDTTPAFQPLLLFYSLSHSPKQKNANISIKAKKRQP